MLLVGGVRAVLGTDGAGPPVVTTEHGRYRDRVARTGDAELVTDRPCGPVRIDALMIDP